MNYWCDFSYCHFFHQGWCAYHDSTIDLMRCRNTNCKMDVIIHNKIDEMMD